MDLDTLNRQLDELEAGLPDLIAQCPSDADFWPAFAGQADRIEDHAGDHAPWVHARIQKMLAKHGRYIASVDIE